jgi:hypothetical protein
MSACKEQWKSKINVLSITEVKDFIYRNWTIPNWRIDIAESDRQLTHKCYDPVEEYLIAEKGDKVITFSIAVKESPITITQKTSRKTGLCANNLHRAKIDCIPHVFVISALCRHQQHISIS